MSSPESFGSTLQFGDVVQVGYPDADTGEIAWREPRVVMGVSPSHLELSQIVVDEGEILLNTIGTEWGVVRHIEDAERWTPTQAAIAMIEGLWGYSEEERIADDYEILRMIAESIDSLRASLEAEEAKGPIVYTYTPKVGNRM